MNKLFMGNNEYPYRLSTNKEINGYINYSKDKDIYTYIFCNGKCHLNYEAAKK